MATAAELEKRIAQMETEYDKRIVALGERVVALEGLSPVMPRDLNEFRNSIGEALVVINEKIDAIAARPVETTSVVNDELRNVVSALHERIMGVPLGAVQKLDD